MNARQLREFIRHCLEKSPLRTLDIVAALEERLHQAGDERALDKVRQGRDALDHWLAACLAEATSDETDQLGARVAARLDEFLSHTCELGGQTTSSRTAAYRSAVDPSALVEPLPFSDEEIREQVRGVLATAGRTLRH